MSDAVSREVLGWAEIGGQGVELLPARTVLTTYGYGDDGGDADVDIYGGDGGNGGDGGFAYADASHNYNQSYWGDAYQVNYADADANGGDGGDGGDVEDVYVDANGGDGGDNDKFWH